MHRSSRCSPGLTGRPSGHPKGVAFWLPLNFNVMPPLRLLASSCPSRVAVATASRSLATSGAGALVACVQAGLLTAPARTEGREILLVLRRSLRLAARGRPWVRASRLSRWGRVVVWERGAFVVGAAHNSSSERTAQRPPRALWSAAQLQR